MSLWRMSFCCTVIAVPLVLGVLRWGCLWPWGRALRFEVGDALPSPPQGHRRGLTGMQRSRSRARSDRFTHLSKNGIRELVSNPKNWSGARFKVPLSPGTDIDVVGAYYRKHFASSADKPSEKPSDTQSLRLGDHAATHSFRQKEFPQRPASAAEVQRLSRMKIVGDRVAI